MEQDEIDEFYSSEYFLLNEGYLKKDPSDEFKTNNPNIIQREIISTKWKKFIKKYEDKLGLICYGRIEYLAKDYPFAAAFIWWAGVLITWELVVWVILKCL